MLEQVTRHIANYQEVKSQAEQLIQETHAQADALQGFMGRRSKDAVSAPQKPANPTDGQCLSGAFLGSEAVKEAMTEISSYNILITAAESAGDSETRLYAKRSETKRRPWSSGSEGSLARQPKRMLWEDLQLLKGRDGRRAESLEAHGERKDTVTSAKFIVHAKISGEPRCSKTRTPSAAQFL